MNKRIKKKLKKRDNCFHYKQYKNRIQMLGKNFYPISEKQIKKRLDLLCSELQRRFFGGKS